jgi:hypothetical protein
MQHSTASDTSKVNHERCTRCDAEPNYGSKRQIDYETETQFVVLTFHTFTTALQNPNTINDTIKKTIPNINRRAGARLLAASSGQAGQLVLSTGRLESLQPFRGVFYHSKSPKKL